MRGLSIALAALCCASAVLVGRQARTRTAYVAVADGHGVPVTSLTANDFSIQVDGKVMPSRQATATTDPLSVALLVDGFDEGDARRASHALQSLIAMVRRRAPKSRVALLERTPTSSELKFVAAASLSEGFSPQPVILGRPGPPLGSILERVIDATAMLRSEPNQRRAIFVISTSRLEIRMTPKTVIDALRNAGASLWNLDVTPARVTGPPEPVFSPWAHDESDLDKALDASAKASGGWRDLITGTDSLDATMTRMADVLLSEYAVTIAATGAIEGTLRVGVTRKGVRVFAPIWLAERE